MRHSFLVLAMVAWGTSTGTAQDAESYLHKAYYLETQEGRIAEAVELYEKVLQERDAPDALRKKAERRLAGCREQLQSADLLRLLPEGALAYAEVREPGKHLARIVEKIGLTREDIAADALPFGISPRLLQALKEGERIALAVTGIDERGDIPEGVVIFDAGHNDLAFGAIDTMLSGAAAAGEFDYDEPLHGHTTYRLPMATVTVTERLMIAGNARSSVAAVVDRLHGEGSSSVTELLGEFAADREDALVFALVDGQRVLGRLRQEMERHGRVPEEFRILQAFADIDRLRYIAARVATDDDGVAGDLVFELEKENHAIAYHLLRTPAVSDQALAAVPADAAAVVAFRLSEAEGLGAARTAAAWQATGLDIGREIFGNVDDVVAFVVPPGDDPSGPVPDLAIVLDVKDPRRSEALWSELLRVGATLAGKNPETYSHEEIAGRDVRVYDLPERMHLYFCALEDRIVLSVTEYAMTKALGVAAGAPSLHDSEMFQDALASVRGGSKIAVLDVGSILEAFGPLLQIPPREASEIREVVGDSLVSLSTKETASSLRGSLRIGWPRVGPWLRELLGRERAGRPRPLAARARHQVESSTAERAEADRARSAARPATRRSSRRDQVRALAQTQAASRPSLGASELFKELIPLGAAWEYFDRGTDPGSSWTALNPDDKKWKRGHAPLGYGDEALATVVSFGDDARKKHATTFFRSTFTVDHPEQFDALRIHLRRDDGVAVYINGKQVARDNLPDGASWNDYCKKTVGGSEERRYLVLPVDARVVRPGKNVIAVEVHQARPESSDIVFDLGLEGVRGGDRRVPEANGSPRAF